MARKHNKRVDTSGASGPLKSSPFAGLADKLGQPEGAAPAATTPSAAAGGSPTPRRAVVRYQRKGRGGKEVTLVERLELPIALLDIWLKELKQSLGCGGLREGEGLVLQGDQRERLPALLRQRGVRQISCS